RPPGHSAMTGLLRRLRQNAGASDLLSSSRRAELGEAFQQRPAKPVVTFFLWKSFRSSRMIFYDSSVDFGPRASRQIIQLKLKIPDEIVFRILDDEAV